MLIIAGETVKEEAPAALDNSRRAGLVFCDRVRRHL